MAVSIRPVTMQDYPALVAIRGQHQTFLAQKRPEIFQQGTSGLTETHIRYFLEDSQAMAFVAEEHEQIVGYVFVHLCRITWHETFRPHVMAKITDLVVTEQARGQGIDSRLFEAAKLWARRQRAERLELVVWELDEPARTLAEQLGMQTLSRTMSLPLV